MNENQLTNVKEHEFDNPLIRKIDSLIDNSIRDCHDKYFHTLAQICENDLNLTKITKNEIVTFTISDECMGMYEVYKNLAIARENGFKFNQLNKLAIKIYSNLSNINIHYHLRLGSPPLHRQFFIKLSKKRHYVPTYFNDRRNPFHFACRQWYSYNNPQYC